MSATDLRRPALVRDDFRRRIADLLAPMGFAASAKGDLVRREGKNTHRVQFSSSHRNVEGHVVCWVSFTFDDGAVRARHRGWSAGGTLHGHVFDGGERESNIAIAGEADALAALVLRRLAFFELMERPATLLGEVSRRYVPGIVDPQVIVPYLTVRLGPDAAASYARALLGGRQELWPAFAWASGRSSDDLRSGTADHGTQLARALATEGFAPPLVAPADVVASTDPRAGSLRCFFGRQLRAWGEPEAAAALRRLPDAEAHAAHAAQQLLHGPLVDSVAAAQVVLRAAVGEDRLPRRGAPEPRLFQYYPLHEPFG